MVEAGELSEVETVACQNIGPKERQIRVRTGYIWGAISLISAALMVAQHAPWQWRLLLIAPAGISAFGFFQAQANVCVAFAAANIKVLGDSRRDRQSVTDEAERAAFKKVSRGIFVRGIAAAAAFTALVMTLP